MKQKQIDVLIVDDEPFAREGVRLLLQQDKQFTIVAECANGAQAVSAINSNHIDIVFLDIQMPEMDGFEVLKAIQKDKMPVIIFVTAYDSFALQAFKVHALDYLLKPYSNKEFYDVLEHAKEFLALKSVEPLSGKIESLLQEVVSKKQSSSQYLNRIAVPNKGNILVLNIGEIDWIEAADYYAYLHVGSKSHLIRETLTKLEEKLNPDQFIRIHRSTIVRIDAIKELRPFFGGESVVILQNDTKLKLGKTYKQKLKKFLNLGE